MVIALAPRADRAMALPSRTALAPLTCTAPNWSGATRPRPTLGASWTPSADEFEELYCTVTLYVPPVVLFFIAISQSLPLCWVIETVTESPALMESGTSREDWGSISIHDV